MQQWHTLITNKISCVFVNFCDIHNSVIHVSQISNACHNVCKSLYTQQWHVQIVTEKNNTFLSAMLRKKNRNSKITRFSLLEGVCHWLSKAL